jgi:hypothetical protein
MVGSDRKGQEGSTDHFKLLGSYLEGQREHLSGMEKSQSVVISGSHLMPSLGRGSHGGCEVTWMGAGSGGAACKRL